MTRFTSVLSAVIASGCALSLFGCKEDKPTEPTERLDNPVIDRQPAQQPASDNGAQPPAEDEEAKKQREREEAEEAELAKTTIKVNLLDEQETRAGLNHRVCDKKAVRPALTHVRKVLKVTIPSAAHTSFNTAGANTMRYASQQYKFVDGKLTFPTGAAGHQIDILKLKPTDADATKAKHHTDVRKAVAAAFNGYITTPNGEYNLLLLNRFQELTNTNYAYTPSSSKVPKVNADGDMDYYVSLMDDWEHSKGKDHFKRGDLVMVIKEDGTYHLAEVSEKSD